MNLQRTAARSSRITKPAQRKTPSPFATLKRQKSSTSNSPQRPSLKQSRSGNDAEFDVYDGQLEDNGILNSLATDLRFSDTAQLVRYIHDHMFAPIPERSSGLSSTRVAEILNFRVRLPPIVSVAHVYALSAQGPTRVEREIGELVARGVVRKVTFPARDAGGADLGEGLVLVEEWQKLVRACGGLDEDIKDKYCIALAAPGLTTNFGPSEIAALMNTGFLTRATRSATKVDLFSQISSSTLGSLNDVVSSGSSYISGTADAAGENSREHINGAGHRRLDIDSRRGQNSTDHAASRATEQFTFALPNTGPYLKLVNEAKAHMVGILAKSSRAKELPGDLLFDRWDGGIAGADAATKAAQLRGEFRGVTPGKTRKWRQFYGLQPRWVLEECLGAGSVECFKTGAVGVGVRVI